MADRKRTTKKTTPKSIPKKNNDFVIEIYGIITIAISLLLGISIYKAPQGEFGVLFRQFFMGLLGIGSYVFPVLVLIIGVTLVISRGSFTIRKRFVGICLLLLNVLIMIQVSYSAVHIGEQFGKRLNNAFVLGQDSIGGGIVGELVDIPLIYVFGKPGSYIVLVCLMVIFTIVATEVSFGALLHKLVTSFHSLFAQKREEYTQNRLTKKAETERSVPKTFAEPTEKKEKNEKKSKLLDFITNDKNLVDVDSIADDGLTQSSSLSQESEVDPLETLLSLSSFDEKPNHIKNAKEPAVQRPRNVDGVDAPAKIEGKQLNIDELIHSDKTDVPMQPVYKFPAVTLLNEPKTRNNPNDKRDMLMNAKILQDTLKSFGVEAKVLNVSRGPSVTRYELQPDKGVKVSKITNLSDDLALNLAASAVRIEAPIPGKAAVGIEVPNLETVPVMLREVIESDEFNEFNSRVAFALGKDISGKCIVTDISKMPHLLIAGATGSGKSVCINTLITSLIYKSSPEDVKMLMIDPKVVELSVYNGIPHLLIPVVTDPKKASGALYWAVNEMTNRYKLFADNNVRNIEGYNKLIEATNPAAKIPQIVIIIDELADLMMAAPNDVEDTICRLAQMARAAGMHLVIATQRPSVDVITGVIKANIPSRISFAVSSQIDSRTILDMSGAEKLLGKGDMLFMPIGESKPLRVQGAFISEKEVENIVDFLKQSAKPDYNEDIIEEIEKTAPAASGEASSDVDELLPEAIRVAIDYGQVSASMLQRRLRVGYNRAARLVEEMEHRGIAGPQDGSRPRQILISKEEFENNF